MRKEGIGSYFHYEEANANWHRTSWLPLDYMLFYTGRHALVHILNSISKQQQIAKIWVPQYYCQHTLCWLKKFYPTLHSYQIDPFNFNNAIAINDFAAKNDVVLINNYWGLSNMQASTAAKTAIIIEDHSHGWLSQSCQHSMADYCFSSIRKSLPIPLGGIAWSPKGKLTNTNFKEDASFYALWDKMEEGMRLKKQFMEAKSDLDSNGYLKCFYEVEAGLNQNKKFVRLQESHKKAILQYLAIDSIVYKQDNLKILYAALEDNAYYKIIKKEGRTAFGLGLLFKNQAHFQALRRHLIANKIYPSLLWPDNSLDTDWQYYLNIHIDFRYQAKEMAYIVRIITNWVPSKD
jgi:hypothetical protein